MKIAYPEFISKLIRDRHSGKKSTIFFICLFAVINIYAQEDDMLSLLGEEETTDYATASFKTNRVINLHSLESTAFGELDFKINHRFGYLNGGAYELFGLDQASIRIGFDYGFSERLTVGVGRSSYEKTFDGFVKYKILQQSSGAKNMPVTAAVLGTSAIKSIRWSNPDRDNLFSSRLYYTTQLIVGRKFSDALSVQLSPTFIHRNLVRTSPEKNDVFALGIAARQKLTARIAINAEYIYLLPDQVATGYRNSFSIGFDIETGGHVFQLHFTNSTSMIEKGYMTETNGEWMNGDVHFGFNVSRVFTVRERH